MYRLFILGLILFSIGAKAQYGANKGTLNVRFVVDASSLSGVKNFGVRGGLSPLSWEYTTELHDEDGNGVYEGEITISNASNFLEYKYVYGERDLTWEFEGQNRILILDSTQMEVKDTWGLRNILEIEKLPTLSAEALSEDFKLLKQALLEIHPGIYRYNTKAQVDSIFKQYESECLRPQTYREAFLNFTRLTAAFKCGHTYPNFYNQSDFIQEVVFGQQDKLPFAFRVLDKRMFVIQGVGDGSHIPLGSEIVSIDGVPVQSLLEEVAALIKADGGNEYKRFADLNTFGIEGTYEVFDVYFPLPLK